MNYARTLLQFSLGLSNMALWIRIPLAAQPPPSSPATGSTDPWDTWNALRCTCDHAAKVGVALTVPASLPSAAEINRWLGEPVKALLLPTSVFVSNRRGYPSLSRAHQELLLKFFGYGVQVILTEVPWDEPAAAAAPAVSDAPAGSQSTWTVVPGSSGGRVVQPPPNSPARLFWEYLSYLFRRPEPLSEQEQLEMNYRDFLQVPLQPLQDNLESQTYEVFEKDVTKYTTYEDAIALAISSLRPSLPPATHEAASSSSAGLPNGTAAHHNSTVGRLVIMVVGAGRGPLVRASLQAAKRTRRSVHVYAVEKNPNAVLTLHRMVALDRWEGQVTVVGTDMRAWQPPEQADILVSELLGSFGDNELSPECLNGAQRLLAPHGICIPSSYTSFMQPVTAAKLWNDARAYKDLEHMETPYVAKLHRVSLLASTQPVFTFAHPTKGDLPPNNARHACLHFERRNAPAALCHGFAGYFEAVLFGDVTLSTHPRTHTPNMFSWFPIFFPLKEPITCPAGRDIEISMWRCTAAHKVWYEWAIARPTLTSVHNPMGRSYFVGL